jgi:hypothetical protein
MLFFRNISRFFLLAIVSCVLFYTYENAASTVTSTSINQLSSSPLQDAPAFLLSSPAALTPVLAPEFHLAHQESLGYFDDIPEHHWRLKKNIARKRVHISRNDSNIQTYYQNNWNPDFSCDMEDFVGRKGDSKWVCDPHRLNKKDCLVYSVGSGGALNFEQHLSQLAPLCEIHIFDYIQASKALEKYNLTSQVFYHDWGIKDESHVFFRRQKKRRRPIETLFQFKTLTETMETLGHTKRRIDVFKVHCRYCEFYAYPEWLKHDIRQLLVETRKLPLPEAGDFFQALYHASYVIFHKEPDLTEGGRSMEFAFLKLDQSFRNLTSNSCH